MNNNSRFGLDVARTMRAAFYDVSRDGVLVYLDPSIGALANHARQLVAVVNQAKARIELRLHGRLQAAFELRGDVVSACHGAFKAYFETFAALCREQDHGAIAA